MPKGKLNLFLKISIITALFTAGFLVPKIGITTVYSNDVKTEKAKILPIYRLWSTQTKDHMITTDPREKEVLQNEKWNYEGIEGFVYESGQINTTPLYRFYNKQIHDHYCTISEKFKEISSNVGYAYEGVIGYIYTVQQPNTIPLFQFYNEVRQDHFVTTDDNFNKYAKQLGGYVFQIIEGYVLKPAGGKQIKR